MKSVYPNSNVTPRSYWGNCYWGVQVTVLQHGVTQQGASRAAHKPAERRGNANRAPGNGPAWPEADSRKAERSGVRLDRSHRIQFPADITKSGAWNGIMSRWRKSQIQVLQWEIHCLLIT